MESLKDIALRQQKDGPGFFDDPAQDRLLKLLLELAEEICVLRDRLATAEELAANGEAFEAGAIDGYVLSDEEVEERLARHQAFYEELFRKLGSGDRG